MFLQQGAKPISEGLQRKPVRLRKILYVLSFLLAVVAFALPILTKSYAQGFAVPSRKDKSRDLDGPPVRNDKLGNFDAQIFENAQTLLQKGKRTFRLDTFGDEAFWGGTLQLHRAIEGANLGGVGPGISPNTALNLGLKVDVDALPRPLINQIRQGRVNLNDPATTVALLKLDAVVGVKGFFQDDRLNSIGLTCAVCHSTVDNSFVFGIGHRLDGWANRD